MSASSDSFVAKTSLDYIAEGYWQDFLGERPIAGGIAYEAQLQACKLDETLASLQRVDTLLSQIRRDNAKHVTAEADLLADDRFRHLLWFLAFYVGRILAREWKSLPHWYSQSELRRRYPDLSLSVADFYQEMAVAYRADSLEVDGTQVNSPEVNNDLNDANPHFSALFFALEPIGLRLFGHIDRQFVAAQGGQIASGLYQAVKERLPQIRSQTSQMATTTATIQRPQANTENKPEYQQKLGRGQSVDIDTKPPTHTVLSSTTAQLKPTESGNNPAMTADIKVDNHVNKSPNSQTKNHKAANKNSQPTPEVFTRLLTELNEIEVPQNAGIKEYEQACHILDQFERHIAKQNKPRAQVKFSDTHQAAHQQALSLLQKSANAGHTAAMLRLAMYELLGEVMTEPSIDTESPAHKDKAAIGKASKDKGISLVKQAADANDSRAQRLLSKLYYQGFGLTQDIAMGKYWLEQAAANGHPEAMIIDKQWQQAQLLMTTKAQEQHSLKRYQLLIGMVVLVALLLIIFV
ncbi:tetratricopeptide repeat protein [Psychrobacter sp. 1Y11]|uniref:tetratricopeptide repeat protein n=1 Tax=Psychrobacter sp. 1Y11 TaxID=3457446 RepID=UPI003FD4BD2F